MSGRIFRMDGRGGEFINMILLLLLPVIACSVVDQTGYYSQLVGQAINFYAETGYIALETQGEGEIGKYFYHLFLKQGTKSLADLKPTDRFTIWLNGGPGCASQYGAFQEIGPFKITSDPAKKYKIELNVLCILDSTQYDNSWNAIAHLLFVDQPLNVGLSVGKSTQIITDSDTAAEYLTQFLNKFFNQRQQLKDTDLYVFGESYAGHYVPAFARALLQAPFRLKGIAYGNGWTNPVDQLSYYASYLYNIGVISDNQRQQFSARVASIQSDIYHKNFRNAFLELNKALEDVKQATGQLYIYNFQKYEGQDIEDSSYINFILDSYTQFQVDPAWKYQVCNNDVYVAFAQDFIQNRSDDLDYLLSNGISVLIYTGHLDFSVNSPGVLNYVNQLRWPSIRDWRQAQKGFIKSNSGQTCGSVKTHKNLSVVTLYRAGHKSPVDNRECSYNMIQSFLSP